MCRINYFEYKRVMTTRKYLALKKLQSLLRYYQQSGVSSFPHTDDIQKFLKSSIELENIKQSVPDVFENQKAPKIGDNISLSTIGEIEEEVGSCKSCDLCRKRIFPVPGRGSRRAKLFIVGVWLSLHEQSSKTSQLFGMEEDFMLERMIAAIKLSPDDVFISNVIKCGIDASVQPRATNITACLSYLHRQIAAVSPLVICAMGIVAARSLLQISQPLSQVRGRFQDYRLDDERTIPLMATYHPTFLLQNPEMKKATWEDLQAIAKKLQEWK